MKTTLLPNLRKRSFWSLWAWQEQRESSSSIIKASETHWRAAAWYLERTEPEDYGNKVKASSSFVEHEKKSCIPKDVIDKFSIAFRIVVMGKNPRYRFYFNEGLPIAEPSSATLNVYSTLLLVH